MWKCKAETDCKGIGRDEGKWFYLAQSAGRWGTVWLIDLHWFRALTVPLHLGLIDGFFVPHNLTSAQESSVPLPKFQMTSKVKDKVVCSWRKVCRNCSFTVTGDSKHECIKRFCNYCNKRQLSGHFCYVVLLKPSKLTDRFLCVFFDTECTLDLEKRDGSFEHVPNLICAQQMCSKCEVVDDLSVDFKQCSKHTLVFWAEDPVGKFIDYLRWSRPFADKIYIISHNSRG